MTITPKALAAAARRAHERARALNGGLTMQQAFVVAYAELAGQPLDVTAFDDSAVILRAERLIVDGVGVAEALAAARAELATWSAPS